MIGWLPWGDNEVVSMKGDYLGTIVDRDRIYYFTNHPYRGNPGYPGYPGFAGYKPLPSGAKDIVIKK